MARFAIEFQDQAQGFSSTTLKMISWWDDQVNGGPMFLGPVILKTAISRVDGGWLVRLDSELPMASSPAPDFKL